MSNYDKEKSQLTTIANHLNKMNIPFDFRDFRFGDIVKPTIRFTAEYNNFDFDIVISAMSYESREWLSLRCIVYNFSKLKIEQINNIFELCLEINFYIPETTFSVNGDLIFIENDMPINISIGDFEFELTGFDVGIQNFLDHMKDLGFKVEGTKEQIN
ncbi:MAG: hypothetical protein ACTSPY_18530 [Candidatus Helarchaeota archaeon]